MDAPLHVIKGARGIGELQLNEVIGTAVVLDLTHLGKVAPITPEVLAPHAADIREGDIIILRTDWTDKMWPSDEYWLDSPYLTEEGALWLADRRPKAIAVDFLEEWASRLVDVKAEDFVADVALLSRGVLLIKGLIGIGQLKRSASSSLPPLSNSPVRWKDRQLGSSLSTKIEVGRSRGMAHFSISRRTALIGTLGAGALLPEFTRAQPVFPARPVRGDRPVRRRRCDRQMGEDDRKSRNSQAIAIDRFRPRLVAVGANLRADASNPRQLAAEKPF